MDIYSCDHPYLVRESIEHRGVVVEREPEVVCERIFPTPKSAIVFVVSFLAFRFTIRHSRPIVAPSKFKTNDFQHSGELRKALLLRSVPLSSCVFF